MQYKGIIRIGFASSGGETIVVLHVNIALNESLTFIICKPLVSFSPCAMVVAKEEREAFSHSTHSQNKHVHAIWRQQYATNVYHIHVLGFAKHMTGAEYQTFLGFSFSGLEPIGHGVLPERSSSH